MRALAAAAAALVTVLSAAGCGGGSEAAAGQRDAAPTISRSEPIVVDESIGPVRIGMTADEVRFAVGGPDTVRPSELHAGWERWRYRGRRLTVTLTEAAEVWDVRTRARRYRSDRGLRVGLRERAVRRRLPDADCRPYGGPQRYDRWRVCTNGSELDGPFTRVLLIRRVAREIRVSRGLAL